MDCDSLRAAVCARSKRVRVMVEVTTCSYIYIMLAGNGLRRTHEVPRAAPRGHAAPQGRYPHRLQPRTTSAARPTMKHSTAHSAATPRGRTAHTAGAGQAAVGGKLSASGGGTTPCTVVRANGPEARMRVENRLAPAWRGSLDELNAVSGPPSPRRCGGRGAGRRSARRP